MIINFGSIIDHGHHIWIISLVIIVEGIKEHSQPVPLVRAAKHWSFNTRFVREPESLPKIIKLILYMTVYPNLDLV